MPCYIRYDAECNLRTEIAFNFRELTASIAGWRLRGGMIEVQSFIDVKFNVGLGESNFER